MTLTVQPDHRRLTRAVRRIGPAALASILSLAAAAQEAPALMPNSPSYGDAPSTEVFSDACHAFTPDAEYVTTTVIRQLEGGSVTLRVPRQYFEDRWDLAGNHTGTAQLFRVEVGSFEPVTRRETGERNRQGTWNWTQFIVRDVISLELVAQLAADRFANPQPPLSDYPPRPGPHGLTWLQTPFASDSEEPDEDAFIFPSPPAPLQTVVSCCSPLDQGACRFPGCSHDFRAAGLDVSMNYRLTELVHWREFQAQVTDFLTCATSEAS